MTTKMNGEPAGFVVICISTRLPHIVVPDPTCTAVCSTLQDVFKKGILFGGAMVQNLLLLVAAAVVSSRLDASLEDVATATRYFTADYRRFLWTR